MPAEAVLLISSEMPPHWSAVIAINKRAVHLDSAVGNANATAAAEKALKAHLGDIPLSKATVRPQPDSTSCGVRSVAHVAKVALLNPRPAILL